MATMAGGSEGDAGGFASMRVEAIADLVEAILATPATADTLQRLRALTVLSRCAPTADLSRWAKQVETCEEPLTRLRG